MSSILFFCHRLDHIQLLIFVTGLHPKSPCQATRVTAEALPNDHGEGVQKIHQMFPRVESSEDGPQIDYIKKKNNLISRTKLHQELRLKQNNLPT
jgi:hypothetical protein